MSISERYEFLLQETEKHVERLRNAFDKLKQVGIPLDARKVEDILNSGDKVAYLDQIAYRYSKVQDNLGRLIRLYLSIKGENVDNLTMIDVLNLAERYNLGISKEKWFELRELRNLIVHEYETQTQKIADTVNRIYEELSYIESLLHNLKE